MDAAPIQLDKLQIASFRLADTICGYFGGDHPITTIASAKAITALLRDIQKFYIDQNLLSFRPFSSGEGRKSGAAANLNHHLRLVANFAKHADVDINTRAEIKSWHAGFALYTATVDYTALVDDLLEANLATVDYVIGKNTDIGAGTRTTVLIDLFHEAMRNLLKKIQAYNADCRKKGIGGDNPPDYTKEEKQSVYELILKNDLRMPEDQDEELRLIDPPDEPQLRFRVP